MSREEQPVERPGYHGDERIYDHPAFGQIGASRVQGRTTLYGSEFEHQHFVTITIRRSELHRNLSRDWHMGRDELIEVAMSEAQWATFVSAMNSGLGVPCTIQRLAGEGRLPDVPLRVEQDVTNEEFKKKVAETDKLVTETIAEIEGVLGASVSNTKRDRILQHLHKLHKSLSDSMPFIAKSFDEHMEDTVEKAKVEVSAYMQNAIQRAGLQALTGEAPPLRLGSGSEKESEE